MTPPYLTGVAGTGTGQYLVDQNGAPFLVRGDTLWGLAVNAGINGGASTWQSDIDLYMSTRAAQGFNAAIVSCSPDITMSNRSTVGGSTWDGVYPWVGGSLGNQGTQGSFNSNWWTRVDYCLTSAATYGITVFLNITNHWAITQSGEMLWNLSVFYAAYGAALGNRYKSAPNLVWFFGNDYDGSYDSVQANVLTAIRGTGDTHLLTIENSNEGDSAYMEDISNTVAIWGTANANINFVYTYNVYYACENYAYGETTQIGPSILGDGNYDTPGGISMDGPTWNRAQVWWSLASGMRGHIYGRSSGPPTGNFFQWVAGTSAVLTTNTFDNATIKAIWNVFASLTDWQLLVPDRTSALVTAGRGTAAALVTQASGYVYMGGPQDVYVTASITPSGSLAVIYIPNASTAITVNGALMAAGYGAWWIDPVSGAKSAATVASTYSHSVANSYGGTDWVLALTAPPYAAWTVP